LNSTPTIDPIRIIKQTTNAGVVDDVVAGVRCKAGRIAKYWSAASTPAANAAPIRMNAAFERALART
jgi:hypothetical protein